MTSLRERVLPRYDTPLFVPPLLLPGRPPSNTSHRPRQPRASLILGLNQYTHDASVAIIQSDTGKLLFAQSKERLTRRKHDAGDLSCLIPHALEAVEAKPEHVSLVVANNHHFRIAPFERRLPFSVAMGYHPSSYLSPWNLLGASDRKVELSHHLAHAYAAVYAAPFSRGIVIVMDGMGDALDDWLASGSPPIPRRAAPTLRDPAYFTEETVCPAADVFREYPQDVRSRPGASFREAESAYLFETIDGRISFTRLFKRWTQEIAPPELPNHSFEEMESVGAIYSRVSAILFKDWNACGKVMGLAPYAQGRSTNASYSEKRHFIQGQLFDGTLSVQKGQLKGLDHIEKSMKDCNDSVEGRRLRAHFETLAFQIQKDLEHVVSTFVSELHELTGERDFVFSGGVALNSSVNGLLSEHTKVNQFLVPPFPGDEGISIGCALFGYSNLVQGVSTPASFEQTFMPYLGKLYSDHDILEAINSFEPWLKWRRAESDVETAKALSESKVVARFSGRSEFGPRALGCRSILADPREQGVLDHINNIVKKRESFRPFAPTVLSEHAPVWFEECTSSSSPYMSLTKRAQEADRVPAVVHVDGTSRLQTLSRDQNETYYDMISHFHDRTGIPMVLNTSFNTAGEPIVESPQDAIRCFLKGDGIDLLAFPGIIVEKNTNISLDEDDIISTACAVFRSDQVHDCYGNCLRTTITYSPKALSKISDIEEGESFEDTAVLKDALQLSIMEMIHISESCSVAEIFDEFVVDSNFPGDEAAGQDPDVVSEEEVRMRLSDLLQKCLIFKQNG